MPQALGERGVAAPRLDLFIRLGYRPAPMSTLAHHHGHHHHPTLPGPDRGRAA